MYSRKYGHTEPHIHASAYKSAYTSIKILRTFAAAAYTRCLGHYVQYTTTIQQQRTQTMRVVYAASREMSELGRHQLNQAFGPNKHHPTLVSPRRLACMHVYGSRWNEREIPPINSNS